MPSRQDHDDLPYRSAITEAARAVPTSRDETQYSTLRVVQQELAEIVDGLSKNFNAFDIFNDEDIDVASKKLLRQVEVKQAVYDIVQPLLGAVTSAIQNVDNKYKQ